MSTTTDPTEHDAPEVIVKRALRTNWNDEHTLNMKPNVHHGWLDEDYDGPEITISDKEESSVGGDTRYSSINQQGTPHVDMMGTVTAHGWADRSRVAPNNPRQYLFKCEQEIKRITRNNAQAPDSTLDWLSYHGSLQRRDTDRDETMYHTIYTLGYGYNY